MNIAEAVEEGNLGVGLSQEEGEQDEEAEVGRKREPASSATALIISSQIAHWPQLL